MQNCILSPWKNLLPAKTNQRFVVGLLCLGMVLLHGGAAAQCTNNLAVQTYDTVIGGPGYGTYNLKFSKWNADSGLLVSVKVSAVVNLQYGFTLKNVDTSAGSYGLWVGREDYFSSPALAVAYDSNNERHLGTYALNPGSTASMPLSPFLTNYSNVDSIAGNVASFLGVGQVSFTYSPVTYTNIHSANNVSYSYHASVSEVTHFTLSYLYCKGDGVLASSLTAFTASLWGGTSVQLKWSTSKEGSGRVYEVQRSRDGVAFTTIGRQSADAVGAGAVDYSYLDRLTDGAGGGSGAGGGGGLTGKWYYRLRIVDAGGISYSTVQSVNVGPEASGKLLIYPNPAIDHLNLVLPADPGAPGDWRVEIRAADGRLVQSAIFFHSNNLPIFFHQNLSPGVYFLRVTDSEGHSGHTASFRVDAR